MFFPKTSEVKCDSIRNPAEIATKGRMRDAFWGNKELALSLHKGVPRSPKA